MIVGRVAGERVKLVTKFRLVMRVFQALLDDSAHTKQSFLSRHDQVELGNEPKSSILVILRGVY